MAYCGAFLWKGSPLCVAVQFSASSQVAGKNLVARKVFCAEGTLQSFAMQLW